MLVVTIFKILWNSRYIRPDLGVDIRPDIHSYLKQYVWLTLHPAGCYRHTAGCACCHLSKTAQQREKDQISIWLPSGSTFLVLLGSLLGVSGIISSSFNCSLSRFLLIFGFCFFLLFLFWFWFQDSGGKSSQSRSGSKKKKKVLSNCLHSPFYNGECLGFPIRISQVLNLASESGNFWKLFKHFRPGRI